jgi:hypothetical protein
MPGVLDVFDADAFSFVSLSKAVDMMSYVPNYLGSIPGLIEDVPIRTKAVWIERRGNQPALIETTARGAPPSQVGSDKRDARSFNTTRIAQASRVTPDELLTIRRFGSEIDIKDVADEVARRMFKITANIDMTEEFHRLNLVTKGMMLDADGSTIYDWTSEFSSQPSGAKTLTPISSIPFTLSAGTVGTTSGPRGICNVVRRAIMRNLQMGNINTNQVKIVALCDDTFYDQFTTHPEIRSTYVNWDAAPALRESVGEVWRPFPYGGINFVNYRGTDDNSTVAVPAGTVKFFPTNAGIFQKAMAPGEKFEMLGTPGQNRYAMMVRDPLRDMWADVEVYSYPLYVCTLPQALAHGTA